MFFGIVLLKQAELNKLQKISSAVAAQSFKYGFVNAVS